MANVKVLWADDEIDLLKPYVIFLEQKGYQVSTATNGDDAVELCRSQAFDIVFLDENMPGRSGLETLTEIKTLRPAMPVVMITKSEEENIMEQAIGQKIADYLIKPVNPNQILMTLKKHVHNREIVQEQTDSHYRQEFREISDKIDQARTFEQFVEIQHILVRWELQLQAADSPMREMLSMQKVQAETAFAKFVQRNYESFIKSHTPNDGRPLMSHEIVKTHIFPMLDNGDKVFFVVIDNFRYDQWKIIEPLLTDVFNVTDDSIYCSILPTATQYARNAIFSGLMPLQIQQMYPDLWVEEGDEEGKNLHEQELFKTQLDRFRRNDKFTYTKINESDFCEQYIKRLKNLHSQLNIVVLNFIDMLSHSRTESKMMRELANDEAAYLSLTYSWFRHSPTYELFRRIAQMGYKLVVTTDHGTTRVSEPVKVIGDKNTNVNLRYKVGKALSYNPKDVFEMTDPSKFGLTSPNVSSRYIYTMGSDFFGYPNNFNYYAQYYRNTFQHGGISLDEMLIPLITLEPKKI
mgnify:CR=1 FL=1